MTDSARLAHLRTIRIEELAEGVWAAIAVPGQGSLCNAAIVDLGGRTLIFETLRTPAAAEELLHAAQTLTGRAPSWVVNSHWHDDHVGGNQVFDSTATILATAQTRQLIATRLAAEYAQDVEEMPDFLRDLEARFAAETDSQKREYLALHLAETRAYAEALPQIRATPPDLTFEQSLTIHGERRAVEVITYGGGHTASDALIHLHDEGIVFAGDLAFLDVQPWLPDGNPAEWLRILDQVQALAPRTVMPGHGPLSDTRCLTLTRAYITALQALAEQASSTDVTVGQAAALPVPAPFSDWGYPQFFAYNMRFLMQRIAGSLDAGA